jgi:hypothetical protein
VLKDPQTDFTFTFLTPKFIFKHEKLVDSAVKEYKSEVIYIQWLKNMENAAVPLF